MEEWFKMKAKAINLCISNQLRNGLIIGAIAGFSSLTATQAPSIQNLYTGALAFGTALFIELANQYGLKGKDGTFFFRR